MNLGHAYRRPQRCGLDEYRVFEFALDGALNLLWILFRVMAMNCDPWHYGNFRHLQQALGDVFVHSDGGPEHACANKRQPRKIEQALDGAVFAERSMHHGEDYVEVLPCAAAFQGHK